MAYFLRKEKKKKGTYLQMYESFWDKDRKQPRTKNVKSFGYVEDLISYEIPDPVELNIGHFLLSSIIDELDVKETILKRLIRKQEKKVLQGSL